MMVHSLYINTPKFKYVSSGVNCLIYLLPDNLGIVKYDIVRFYEVYSDGSLTGSFVDSVVLFLNAGLDVKVENGYNNFYLINLNKMSLFYTVDLLVSQSGTYDPTIVELFNNTGSTFGIVRDDIGEYHFVTDYVIDATKTIALNGGPQSNIGSIFIGTNLVEGIITLKTFDSSNYASDDILNFCSVSFKFYL